MFQVPSVSREEIDAWPLTEAGLPTRVVNSAHAADLRTIGQLREWSDSDLLRLRSLGRVSLDQIRYFFKLCGRIERSAQRFASILEVLDVFLDPHQQYVLAARYGFHQRDLKPSRSWMTLQEIGNQDNKTRERIRQIEETGKQKLTSRLATVCLAPFRQFFGEFIDARSKAIGAQELGALWGHEAVGELNPTAILLLLSDLDPASIQFRNGYFSTLSEAEVEQIESAIGRRLEASPAPVGLEQLIAGFPAVGSLPDRRDLHRATAVIAEHLPDIASTVDDRYFRYDTSVHPFLIEIIRRVEGPVHYRTVTNLFNDRVKPRSRKGAGYILDTLNRNPGCVRVDRGIYRVKA